MSVQVNLESDIGDQPDPAAGTTVRHLGQFQRWIGNGELRYERLGSKQYEDNQSEYLRQFENGSIDLISVDVFDTILIREPVCELRRFDQIARSQIDMLAEDFGEILEPDDLLVARLQATHASYAVSEPRDGTREGSIRQIYRVIVGSLGLDESVGARLLEVELAYEAEHLHLNRPLCRWLASMQEGGVAVHFLSDMYLHSEHISTLLKSAGCDLDVPIVSSADHTHNKHGGSAFRSQIAKYDVPAERMLHIGDNLKSDYRMPRRYGMRSAIIPIPDMELDLIATSHDEVLQELLGRGHRMDRWIRI